MKLVTNQRGRKDGKSSVEMDLFIMCCHLDREWASLYGNGKSEGAHQPVLWGRTWGLKRNRIAGHEKKGVIDNVCINFESIRSIDMDDVGTGV